MTVAPGRRFAIRIATAVLLCGLWPAAYLAAQTDDLQTVRKQFFEEEDILGRAMIDNGIAECSDTEWSPLFEQLAAATAKRLDVSGFAMQTLAGDEPAVVADGNASPFALRRFEMSGSGELFAVDRLLRDMALLKKNALDFDTVRIQAKPDAKVSFQARLSRLCLRKSPQIPNSARTALDIERTELAFLRSANAVMPQVTARMRGLQFTTAIGEVVEEWDNRPISLSDLQYAGRTLTLHGIAAGAAARASIPAALRKAGFEVGKIEQAALPCGTFTAVARFDNASTAEHDASGDIFDVRTAADICSAHLTAPVRVAAKGTGNIALRARNVDAPALFMILGDLVADTEGFVVEPGIAKTVDVDIDDATPDEIFAALRSAHAVDVGPGPLHRVCPSACTPSVKSNFDGDPISFQVRNAEAVNVFRTFGEVAGLSISVPPDTSGMLSVYTRKMPWDEVLMGCIDALHFDHAIDKEMHRLYVGRASDLAKPNHAGTVDVGKAHVASPRRPMSELKAENLAAGDLRLAAVARGGGLWRAYAVAPGADAALVAVGPATKLFDGTVESVNLRGMTVRTSSGSQVVIDLPLQ